MKSLLSATVFFAAVAGIPQAHALGNPASAYCTSVGGTLEMRQDIDGQPAFCHLPDGRVVEEWQLFRSASQPAPAVRTPGNPASVYCTSVGGDLEMRQDAQGQSGYCHLPNGRVVEEWQLFHATHQPLR